MNSQERPRILCVDDEISVLDGLTRILRRQYDVQSAEGAEKALQRVQSNGPFAVVMSDLRMPRVDGIALLGQIRSIAPDTVRILLTGHADMSAAIEAVNQGNIFRFLTKPCPTDVLLKSLDAAIEQHSLITAERVLLEQTLHGTVKCLMDILGMVNPAAFGRATRVRHMLREVAGHFEIVDRWPIEVAAMLSQVGYVSLPPQTLEKLQRGQRLNTSEQEMLDRVPLLAEQLIANIPRMDRVREILHYYRKNFDGTGQPAEHIAGEAIPWGARALRLALDLDDLESEEMALSDPLDVLRGRPGYYDQALLDAVALLRQRSVPQNCVKELPLRELKVGMIFAEDVKSPTGLLLISRGQEVTPGLLERLSNFAQAFGSARLVRMILNSFPLQNSTLDVEVAARAR